MPTLRRYQVRISGEAASRLQEILDHIQPQSPQNAPLVIERLLHAIEGLSTLPYRYKVHRPNRTLAMIVRSMPVPPYIVYYRVLEEHALVRILTVRHGAQRHPRRFD